MAYGVASRTTVRLVIVGLCVAVIGVSTAIIRAQNDSSVLSSTPATPGAQADGTTLLANGWRLAPAGTHLSLSTLPLNIALSSDGRYALVTNDGISKPSISVVDLASWNVKSTTQMEHAWLGLAVSPDGSKVYSASASQNNVLEYTFSDGTLTLARTLGLPPSDSETFVGGIALSPNGRTLYVTRLFGMTLSTIDLSSGTVTRTIDLPAEPYTVIASRDGRMLFVSLWGSATVMAFTADRLLPMGEWPSGEHPNAMVVSNDGQRLFVACGSSSSIWVYDIFAGEAIEQISTSLDPEAPPTATPNALALSPDGRTLLAANADNNAVAVIDVSNAGRSFVDGFIPTGWYPTAVTFTRDGRRILIVSGRGAMEGTSASTVVGTISSVPAPDRTTLAEYTRRVHDLSPYSDAVRLHPNVPIDSPIPHVVGGSSPIRHVFYVIRENRTYDQVLGDMQEGNGEPKMTLFGRNVTPNAHALARNFVVFDNFYVDADVSYNGHAYSTAAYSNDFIEKVWQTAFANRGGLLLGEGGGFMRTPFGNIAAPPGGYIWDFAHRENVSVRSYGEFVDHASRTDEGDVVAVGAVPGLQGAVAPAYAGWDLRIPDNKRIDAWLQEFQQYEKDGTLPQLSIIRLPNDHTSGTKPGAPTPRAMVAENDYALGRLVETISNSVYWRDSAIVVLEDDAQSGPDHVDSHRSVLLVASPFAKHGFVDHTFYTTSGVLRTIELILGLPPMSQYDAAATPLYNAFTTATSMATYRRAQPGVPFDETNPPNAFGAAASMKMNFAQADRAPEILLNDIIWRSVKGASSPTPPPRRSVFISPAARNAAADDDDR
jgi:YVTN family beta-propeller protein